MDRSFAVGIDIGGTKIALGIVDDQGKVLIQKTVKTDLKRSAEEMINEIGRSVHQLFAESGLSERDCRGIGIGAPGPLNPKEGKLLCPPNLPNWEGFSVAEQLSQWVSLPIVMENDASAAALAEQWIGAGRNSKHFVYLTISTGIGSGVIVDGKLYTGFSGNAGDVGHMVIDPSQGTCKCGQRGCFEHIASGTAIARRASLLAGISLSTEAVFDMYVRGDTRMVSFIQQTFEYIGMGCVALINIFDPERIVLGGGVTLAGEPLFQAVQGYVSRYALNPSGRAVPIVPAHLDRHAGMIGAAALVLKPGKEQRPKTETA